MEFGSSKGADGFGQKVPLNGSMEGLGATNMGPEAESEASTHQQKPDSLTINQTPKIGDTNATVSIEGVALFNPDAPAGPTLTSSFQEHVLGNGARFENANFQDDGVGIGDGLGRSDLLEADILDYYTTPTDIPVAIAFQTISDGNGGSDNTTVEVTVVPVNDAPVAVGDDASTDEDSPAPTRTVLSISPF
jgi:hypothetical protein